MFVRSFTRVMSALALFVAVSAIAVRPLHAQGGALDIIVGVVVVVAEREAER